MAYETIETKKFLNSTGVGHLWDKIKERYDSKLDSVSAADDSIVVTNLKDIQVQISAEADNRLQVKTTGNKGLYVPPVADQDAYSIVKDDNSGDYAAVYHLQKTPNGTGTPVNVGVAINIPKDMVVSAGSVVTKDSAGDWGPAGTYIELILANATNDHLYIPADSLIEYVTSGSQAGDMVVVTIDPATHRVTAAITDGTITKAKLAQAVQDSLDAADSAVQSVAEGTALGTIAVDGTDVAVHGLDTAAYQPATAFDASGAAAAVLGANTDLASAATVYGVKQYASDVYTAIQALTNAEIDAAIAAANA